MPGHHRDRMENLYSRTAVSAAMCEAMLASLDYIHGKK